MVFDVAGQAIRVASNAVAIDFLVPVEVILRIEQPFGLASGRIELDPVLACP